MNSLEVTTAFASVFDTLEGTLMTLVPIVGMFGIMAIQGGFAWYKTYKVVLGYNHFLFSKILFRRSKGI